MSEMYRWYRFWLDDGSAAEAKQVFRIKPNQMYWYVYGAELQQGNNMVLPERSSITFKEYFKLIKHFLYQWLKPL